VTAPHDSQAVDHLLMRGSTGAGVWGDAAYRSEEIEAKLHAQKLKSYIHRQYQPEGFPVVHVIR
jgi:hypothetical protein